MQGGWYFHDQRRVSQSKGTDGQGRKGLRRWAIKCLVPLKYGAPGRNRTCGTRIRNPLLYPLSYGGDIRQASTKGSFLTSVFQGLIKALSLIVRCPVQPRIPSRLANFLQAVGWRSQEGRSSVASYPLGPHRQMLDVFCCQDQGFLLMDVVA